MLYNFDLVVLCFPQFAFVAFAQSEFLYVEAHVEGGGTHKRDQNADPERGRLDDGLTHKGAILVRCCVRTRVPQTEDAPHESTPSAEHGSLGCPPEQHIWLACAPKGLSGTAARHSESSEQKTAAHTDTFLLGATWNWAHCESAVHEDPAASTATQRASMHRNPTAACVVCGRHSLSDVQQSTAWSSRSSHRAIVGRMQATR